MMSTSRALFLLSGLLLFFHLTLTDGASVVRSAKKPAAVLQKAEVNAKGSVALNLQEEASLAIETGKNDTAMLHEKYASSLSESSNSDTDAVNCKFTMDNSVDSASYGGQNLQIKGAKDNIWEDKSIDFHVKSKAYLVICGTNWEGNSCQTGGFAITCNKHVPSNRGAWQAISDMNRKNGEGSGWHTPCASSSGFFLPANPGAEKMFASSANPACFRWQTPDIDCVMHDWGAWGECSVVCGGGNQVRKRGKKSPGKWGATCPDTEEKNNCSTQACPQSAARGGVALSKMVLIYLTAILCLYVFA
eukprot:TRINITY_DN9181_c0_g1_i1.p1 TRINITY_DN9181_c0_g1~~TRINITY_DN9181_c0_g1_i1.p1  ORF type:complete len:304 (-),score=47.34 TRINITY_DN9181_c0_g1_i1:130-1041(-)